MQKMNPNKQTPFKVRRAELTPIPPESERTPLGRKLMKIVAEIDASDDPPMSEEDLERAAAATRWI